MSHVEAFIKIKTYSLIISETSEETKLRLMGKQLKRSCLCLNLNFWNII